MRTRNVGIGRRVMGRTDLPAHAYYLFRAQLRGKKNPARTIPGLGSGYRRERHLCCNQNEAHATYLCGRRSVLAKRKTKVGGTTFEARQTVNAHDAFHVDLFGLYGIMYTAPLKDSDHIFKAVRITMDASASWENCFVRRLDRKKKSMGREAFSDCVQVE